MRERLALPFPEQNFFAVGEKKVRDVQFLGIGFGLLRRIAWTDWKSLGFDNGQGTSVPVVEYIVSASDLEDIFIADAVLIAGIPALVFKLCVDNNARKRFIAIRHVFAKSFVSSEKLLSSSGAFWR